MPPNLDQISTKSVVRLPQHYLNALVMLRSLLLTPEFRYQRLFFLSEELRVSYCVLIDISRLVVGDVDIAGLGVDEDVDGTLDAGC